MGILVKKIQTIFEIHVYLYLDFTKMLDKKATRLRWETLFVLENYSFK